MSYESNFFLLRTPLLPFQEGLKIFEKTINQTAYLTEVYANPLLQESIFLASSELYQQLIRYLKGELSDSKKIASLEESLIEYLLRMSSRCTPFGIFAGITVGHFGADSTIKMLSSIGSGSLKRKLRFDTTVLSELVRYYDRNPTFRVKTKYVINSSLYKIGNKCRYHGYTIVDGHRSYDLNEIDYISALGKIIKEANEGISIENVVELLISDGFERSDSEAYVQELIDSQILISEIDPSIIGSDFFEYMADKIKAYGLDHNEELTQLKNLIQNVDNDIAGTKTYERLSNILKVYGLANNKKGLFQIDLTKSAEKASLSHFTKENLIEAAQVLINLNRVDLKRTMLETFKKAFSERYEKATIRLVDVMDVEIGINYKKLHEHTSPILLSENANYELIKKYKRNKLQDAVFKGQNITITDAELKKIGVNLNIDSLHQSFSIMAKALDEGGFTFQIESITGPSFAKLLGRFCNSNDELKVEVEKLALQEQKLFPGKIVAEIVHLPEDRIGNVLNRPHLSQYEIVYLGKSRLPITNQIKITDLYLRIDKGRLVLLSKKLGKEVTPRLSSAHNYSGRSLPIYHFLCDMQTQDKQGGIKWFWEDSENENFLPRVTYKNIVLSPATWNISITDLLETKDDRKNLSKITDALTSYFIDVKIEKYVYYTIYDNKLLLDTTSNFGISYLAKKILKERHLKLLEVLLDPNSLIVKSNNDGFANELIIPFVQSSDAAEMVDKPQLIFPPKLKRTFEPGSEWMFYKVYIGAKTANQLLYKSIFPLVKRLFKDGLIKQWFFIRYSDPKPHLRIRFLLNDEKNIAALFAKFKSAINYYLKNALISNLQVDTYVREIERYGEKTMEISEAFFSVNSTFICSVFQEMNWEDQSFKCQLAFKVIDDLLTCLYPDCEKRYDVINLGVESRGIGKIATIRAKKEEYNKKYRGFASEINRYQDDFQQNRNLRNALFAQKKFITNNLTVVTNEKNKDNSLPIVASYIHMFVNRLFDERQNEMEGLLYFYLEKYYRSIFGRERKFLNK